MSNNQGKPSSKARQEVEDELNRRHDKDSAASTESADEGGLAEGGGLGGEAGVTSPGRAADGGPAADPGHTHAAQKRDSASRG